MKEFSMNALLKMRDNVESLKTNIDSAINLKKHFIDCAESVSKLDEAKNQRFFDPDPYYNIKFFDKGIELVKGSTYFYDKQGDLISSGEDLKGYHIKCYHWIPEKLIHHNPLRKITNTTCCYLCTFNLDVAIHWFQAFTLEMFCQSGFDVANFSMLNLIEDKELF